MNNYIHPLHQHYTKQPLPKQKVKQTNSFQDVLSNITSVKVSKHAKARLHERNIEISHEKWDQIGKKMNEAKGKGVTDALVVLDDVALVVSTKNNTVVTALNSNEAADKIFTNINGTILL